MGKTGKKVPRRVRTGGAGGKQKPEAESQKK